MAQTQISDVVVPSVFAPYVQLLSTNLSLLVKTGVIASNPALSSFLAGGGTFIDMPHFNDLADTLANISGDAGSDNIRPSNAAAGNDAAPQNITAGKTVAIRNNRNQSWSAMDLASQLAGPDAMDAIASRVASYWVRQDQLQLNSVIKGLVAGNASLVNDISAADGVDAVGGNLFAADALLDTFQLMGDHKQNISAIAVHSAVHTAMQKLNLIDFVAASGADVGFGTYLGKSLIVDDGLAITTDTDASAQSRNQYFTIAFGASAFQYGAGSPRVAAEVSRQALAGNGGGQEVLTSRREYVLHPAGFTVNSSVAAGQSPTNTELEASDAYTMTFDRKLVPFAVLITNG